MKSNNTNVVHLNKREFKEKIFDYTLSKEWNYKGDIPAIIDFYADWCAPCKMVSPVLDGLSIEYQGRIKIYKVNTEKDPEVAKVFGVSSIPTLLFIAQTGKPMVVRGTQSRQSLKSNIERILPREEKRFLNKLISLKW
ncbi:MAG: thioredoxin domain-containing protein [Bacteroidetes bacterium]|nr:thioredoxin domain-containing protein [Bacteroidota bacterium]